MTPFELAQRYVGIREISGAKNHPLVSWWLSLCGYGIFSADEIPWCSAFVNGIAWEFRLPRSKSAAARSWLKVGVPVSPSDAKLGDVVVLKRGVGAGAQGPEVLQAPGHVGFFAGWDEQRVLILGGNQGDEVSLSAFPATSILGVRRIA